MPGFTCNGYTTNGYTTDCVQAGGKDESSGHDVKRPQFLILERPKREQIGIEWALVLSAIAIPAPAFVIANVVLPNIPKVKSIGVSVESCLVKAQLVGETLAGLKCKLILEEFSQIQAKLMFEDRASLKAKMMLEDMVMATCHVPNRDTIKRLKLDAKFMIHYFKWKLAK